MKYTFSLVIIMCVIVVSTYAQAKITVSENTTEVTLTMSFDKAVKTAVNSTFIARSNSELLVSADNYSTLYVVTYTNSIYTLNELIDDEVNETITSTRISDIRTQAIVWISEVNAH